MLLFLDPSKAKGNRLSRNHVISKNFIIDRNRKTIGLPLETKAALVAATTTVSTPSLVVPSQHFLAALYFYWNFKDRRNVLFVTSEFALP